MHNLNYGTYEKTIYIYSIAICFKLLHREGQSAMKNMINYNIKRLEHQPYIYIYIYSE